MTETILNPGQLATCKALQLNPAEVSFSNGESVNCRVVVNVEGTNIPYYVTRSDFGTLKLDDSPAPTGEVRRDEPDQNQDWRHEPVIRDLASEVDTDVDRAMEAAARHGHRLPKHVAESVVAEIAKRGEGDPSAAMRKIIKMIVTEFIQPRTNLRLRAWALAMAAGLECAVGKTMTSLAGELDVTRAAISKETVAWRDMLNLPESRYCKSDRARESYRRERTENHWRHER